MDDVALIGPFDSGAPETGAEIVVALPPHDSRIVINERDYSFVRESGGRDGAATICALIAPPFWFTTRRDCLVVGLFRVTDGGSA